MITTQTQLPARAYKLTAQYELGEPMRLYQATPMRVRTLVSIILGFYGLVAGIHVLASGFHITEATSPIFVLDLAIVLLACIPIFMHSQLTHNATVYICANGFIARNKKQIATARWDEIARVTSNATYTVCMIQLLNGTSIKLNRNIQQFRFLVTELEMKAQPDTHPKTALEIEQQLEIIRNDPPWLRQTQKQARLYQEMAPYLKQKDPEEAFKLGHDFHLGSVLNTFRPTLKSLFPNSNTWGEWAVTLCLIGAGVGRFPIQIFSWKTFFNCITFLCGLFTCVQFLRNIWHTRLYCYEHGLIYIQAGSFSVIEWGQITKTVLTKPAPIYTPIFTLHLHENETLAISKFINNKNGLELLLRERTLFTEVSPYKKAVDKTKASEK